MPGADARAASNPAQGRGFQRLIAQALRGGGYVSCSAGDRAGLGAPLGY